MRPRLFLRPPCPWCALSCSHRMLFVAFLPWHMQALLLPLTFSENSYASSKTQLLSLPLGCLLSGLMPLYSH